MKSRRSRIWINPLSLLTGIFIILSALTLSACGSARYRETTSSTETASPQDRLDRSPRAERPAESGKLSNVTGGMDETGEEPEKTDEGETPEKPVERMIIYQGVMQIRVVQPAESVRQAGEMAAKLGGFVEKSDFYEGGRRIVIVLRIPVQRFFEAMDLLPRLGTVLSRSLQAEDITREFADVESRLQSARLLKARLEKLLESVKNIDEKVKILREISRLAGVIETLSARSKYLSDRASLSTITLQLTAEPSNEDALDRASPFPWIRSLSPAKRTIEKASDTSAKRPEGFFDNTRNFRDGDPNLFFSPDGTILRAGQLKNRPTGDAAFWRQALSIEFKRRSYQEVKTGSLADGQLWIFQVHDGLNVYYYGLSFVLRGDQLHVFEAFAPGEASYKKDGEKMQAYLRSIAGGGK